MEEKDRKELLNAILTGCRDLPDVVLYRILYHVQQARRAKAVKQGG